MNRLLFTVAVFCLSLFVYSCGSDEKNADENAIIIAPPNNILPYWGLDIINKTVKTDSSANWGYLNADSLISGLNERNPDVILEKISQNGDTINLRIRDAGFLTEEMGSSGARQYLSEVVINLTEVQGINFVNFDFTEGDHASPGLYGKDFVAGYKKINY